MKQELFDIFDAEMNPIGTAPRSEVHAKGLWHQTFQCWILSKHAVAGQVTSEPGEAGLLFQMRHPGKDTFPSLLDISCAGHLLAGERVEDGVRELAEELGVEVRFEQLVSCGTYLEEQYISPELTDRERCHVFLLQLDQPLTSYRLQEDEVTGLYRIALPDVQRIAEGIADRIKAEGVEPDTAGNLLPVKRIFSQKDFVPHARGYYELVIQAAEKASLQA